MLTWVEIFGYLTGISEMYNYLYTEKWKIWVYNKMFSLTQTESRWHFTWQVFIQMYRSEKYWQFEGDNKSSLQSAVWWNSSSVMLNSKDLKI